MDFLTTSVSGDNALTIALSPEAWAALTAIVLPIVAALAANIRLTLSVDALTKQMAAIKMSVVGFPELQRRVAKLEGKKPAKTKAKRAHR